MNSALLRWAELPLFTTFLPLVSWDTSGSMRRITGHSFPQQFEGIMGGKLNELICIASERQCEPQHAGWRWASDKELSCTPGQLDN